MKYRYSIIIVLVLCLGFAVPTVSGENEAAKKQTGTVKNPQEEAAKKSHAVLLKLHHRFYSMLGFSTKEEVKQSVRKEFFHVYMVGLSDLKTFKPGTDPKTLLIDTKKVIYSLYVGDTLKSSLTIRKDGDQWKHAALGGREIHILTPALAKHSQASNMDRSSYFMVRIPAMYLIFLGYYSNGRLFLVPAHSHPDLTFDLHEAIPAEDVFTKLQPNVEKYMNVLTPPVKRQ